MKKMLRNGSFALILILLFQIFASIPIYAEEICGDLNGDGKVNSIDFAYLRGYLLKVDTYSESVLEGNADLNMDGKVNSLDFALLRQYVLGMIKTLPYVAEQPTPTPQTTPQGDWIPFVPKTEDVRLRLVIEYSTQTGSKQTNIFVDITFWDGGYRIADEGELVYSPEDNTFTTSGVKIEKYVGPNGVTLASMQKQIKYPIENQLGSVNHFVFKVGDTSVSEFSFTPSSIIPPTPVPFGAEVNENFVNANTQFAANLFKKFSKEDTDKNVFFSPFSISMALSMVYQGAGTTTRDAIAEALNYKGMSIDEVNQSYMDHLSYFKKLYPQVELNVANSIWVREGFDVKESFLNKNKEVFNAQNSFLDFSNPEACDIMNNWISNATKGKIGNMIKPPIDPEIIMYLMNAIYFNGSWTDQFDIAQTRQGNFKKLNGENKLVQMMNKTDDFRYGEGLGYKAVELPYGSGSVSMYCILPQGNVNSFIENFDNDMWSGIKSSLSMKNVQLSIPRLKIEYEPQNLTGKLSELGMGEAFNRGADFSGIGDDLWIDGVSHKAVIDINEKGTEAAAVTIIGVGTTSMPNTFVADKPFVFVIADNQTGTILFMGKVVNP